ncbi:immunoglobulin-like domain-containing protein [Pseudactinotalea sp. Z1748]|uniref:immunoglobulin-like domain-containing protein n=1 Tax=Pseudactinotalea sp. Z1748 TaxID=3413027 RepID=UPI003C7E2089
MSNNTETTWDDVLDGLSLPTHNGDSQRQTPASSPIPVEPTPAPAASGGRPGYTDKGESSPLIRTRRADLVWFLTAPATKLLAAILTLALAGAAVTLYAIPAADAWWQEQTNPQPSPSEPQDPVIIDGDPVLYGAEDIEADFGADFDPMDGVRALDPEDGDITDDIEIRGEVDTTTSGGQVIRYGIEDSAGNTTHHWRTISVGEEPEFKSEDEDEEAVSEPTQPPAPARVSQTTSLTCTGDVTITFHASGGGNVVLSGSVSGSGSGSVSASTSVSGGGTVSAIATADGNVNIANEWAGNGNCS